MELAMYIEHGARDIKCSFALCIMLYLLLTKLSVSSPPNVLYVDLP